MACSRARKRDLFSSREECFAIIWLRKIIRSVSSQGCIPRAYCEDPVLGSKCGELQYIIDLICNEPVEFNLRVDYGLHSDIREFFENILH